MSAANVSNAIVQRLLDGDRAALSRLISWAEDQDERFAPALAELYTKVGRSWRIGVTGAPGAGKSTLVNELAKLLRARGSTVGILAVDPTSPLTGGALLGDRIRMEERTLDPGVFIRSMATRGSHGGLARAAVDACDVMDAFGFDAILLETVGVGQAEYDVVGAADTVAVVSCPGAGDGIQAMKAGLLEVADVLVVNKSDLPGGDRLADELEEASHVRWIPDRAWEVPVVSCSAGRGEDVDRVLAALERHRAHLEQQGLEAARKPKRLARVRHALAERLDDALWSDKGWGARAQSELERRIPPHAVADTISAAILERVPAAPLAGPLAPVPGPPGKAR